LSQKIAQGMGLRSEQLFDNKKHITKTEGKRRRMGMEGEEKEG